MKKLFFPVLILTLSLAACDGWSYTVPTFPAPPPTITPSILSPTPVIVTITGSASPAPVTPTLTGTPTQPVALDTLTFTATAFTEAPTPTGTPTLPPFSSNLIVEVQGCDTSLDITHGMGEVTNAYVVLKNNTGTDMTNLCTTLFGRDEGRVHPDKTACVPYLAHGNQVTVKVTVDTTSQVDTPIQVEVRSGETLLARIPKDSCTAVGLFAPGPGGLLTPIPIQ